MIEKYFSIIFLSGLLSLITFLISFSLCGLLTTSLIAITISIFVFLISFYFFYISYTTNKDIKSRFVIYSISIISFLTGIFIFIIQFFYFSELNITTRFIFIFIISFGLFIISIFPLTGLTQKYLNSKLLSKSINEKQLHIYFLIFSIIISIILSILMSNFGQKNENEMLTLLSLRSLLITLFSSIIGAIFGFYIDNDGFIPIFN